MNENEQAIFKVPFPALDLFQGFPMPSHSYLNALIVRELLTSLNSNLRISSDELGILLSIEMPWKYLIFLEFNQAVRLLTSPSKSFFLTSYLSSVLRCILEPVPLLLEIVLAKHSSVATHEVTSLILRAIMGMPNLDNFRHDQDIYDTHRLWKTGLRKVRRECAKHEDSKYEGKTDLEEMSCLLEGNRRTLYEMYIYKRNGAGLREAVCVGGHLDQRGTLASATVVSSF